MSHHLRVTVKPNPETGELEQVQEIIPWTRQSVEQRILDEETHLLAQAKKAELLPIRKARAKLYSPDEQFKILRKGGAELVQMNQALDAIEAEAKQRAEEIRASIPEKVAAVRAELEKELPNGTERR